MTEEGSRDRLSYNQIRRHSVGGIEVEMIHQTLPGDCVLINYLNTESLVNGEGKIAMSPRELRDLVIEKRQLERESASDIMQDNSPLSYVDTVRLFTTLYGVPPKQEDIVLVEGNMARQTLRNNIRDGLLEYFNGYESGVCATGMGYHSRTIWKLAEDQFIVIDPGNPNGFSRYDTQQLMECLTNLCANQSKENNFFYFLRTNENE